MLSCTKLTISGLTGALKTAGNAIVEPDASFLSLYTVIRGRAADSDCNQNNNSETAIAPFLSEHIKHDLLVNVRSLTHYARECHVNNL
jgi:hypothetical protein